MDKLKVFIFVLLGLVAAFGTISLFLPAHWRVERAIEVKASPDAIFPYVNNLQKWQLWTHWDTIEPHIQRTYSGPREGVGARQTWVGAKVGKGSVTVTKSTPEHGILYDLQTPHSGSGRGAIRLEANSGLGTTRVTWVTQGDVGLNPISRYFALVMDSYVGHDLQQNLNKLKVLAENTPPP